METLRVDRPGLVSQVSVIELVWVLSGSYELTRQQIAQAIDVVLRAKERIVDRADQVMKALCLFNKGSADFADCLIESICSSAGCERTVTVDVRASKSTGVALIVP
jgi:predicted nucleic-acid-binding protein